MTRACLPAPEGAGRSILASLAASVLLVGCTTPTAPISPPASVTVEQGLSVGERLTLAKELLNHNGRDKARAELRAVLQSSPANPAATQLLREMDEDPVTALGQQSFAYTVRPGDSFTTLATRFLGDPLKFYFLARYNGVAAPADIAVGQVVRIPGYPPRPPSSRPWSSPTTSSPSHRPSPAPAQAPSVAPPQASVVPPVRIRSLRASALESLNRGQVNRAVGLLRQAAQLDPNNALVKRDLARAERIQAAVNRK
jgi:hypothetical protein